MPFAVNGGRTRAATAFVFLGVRTGCGRKAPLTRKAFLGSRPHLPPVDSGDFASRRGAEYPPLMHWIATKIAGELIPDDGCLEVDGTIVARVYRQKHGPSTGEWNWFWQGYPAESGRSPTKDEAKAECERRAKKREN